MTISSKGCKAYCLDLVNVLERDALTSPELTLRNGATSATRRSSTENAE